MKQFLVFLRKSINMIFNHKLLTHCINYAILRELMKNDLWTRGIHGIGEETGKKLVLYMYDAGLIDETYEAYKEAIDHTYFWKKFAKWNVEYVDDETLTK